MWQAQHPQTTLYRYANGQNRACCLQVGVAARTVDNDNEGGELAQLMEALGDDERAAGGIRFGRDDKVNILCSAPSDTLAGP